MAMEERVEELRTALREKLAQYDDVSGLLAAWDEDGSGTLEKEEVVRALLKTLNLQSTPAKVLEMRGTIDAIWPVFDPDGSNSIDKAEFLAAEGLANTIIATVS